MRLTDRFIPVFVPLRLYFELHFSGSLGGRKVWGLPVRVIRAAIPLLFSALSPYYSVLTLLVSLLLVLALLNTTATHPLPTLQ